MGFPEQKPSSELGVPHFPSWTSPSGCIARTKNGDVGGIFWCIRVSGETLPKWLNLSTSLEKHLPKLVKQGSKKVVTFIRIILLNVCSLKCTKTWEFWWAPWWKLYGLHHRWRTSARATMENPVFLWQTAGPEDIQSQSIWRLDDRTAQIWLDWLGKPSGIGQVPAGTWDLPKLFLFFHPVFLFVVFICWSFLKKKGYTGTIIHILEGFPPTNHPFGVPPATGRLPNSWDSRHGWGAPWTTSPVAWFGASVGCMGSGAWNKKSKNGHVTESRAYNGYYMLW